MSETRTSGRIEPSISSANEPRPEQQSDVRIEPAVEARPAQPAPGEARAAPPPAAPPPAAAAPAAQPRPAPTPAPAAAPAAAPAQRPALDQLARIEEKAARIEEKFARSEALMLRLESKVETSTGMTGSLARQEDVVALADRVRRLPGYGALVGVAVAAAVGAAVITVVLLRFLGGGVTP
ncbi:hypothetical protein ACFQU1_03625 [Chelatococcus sp. GCM10030263]|uniref:hypothetical protein n=1 Tax=Chelatococcus sp. GCM10030263 TaxID=3273387 RepID=UPI00360B0874